MKSFRSGRVAQLVRAPASHAGGRRFESCRAHHLNLIESATCNIDSETFPALNSKNVSKPDRSRYTVSKRLSTFLLVGLAV
jgi:hypothetical protein